MAGITQNKQMPKQFETIKKAKKEIVKALNTVKKFVNKNNIN